MPAKSTMLRVTLSLCVVRTITAYTGMPLSAVSRFTRSAPRAMMAAQISSPFDAGQAGSKEGAKKLVGPLPLTIRNVEAVLDELRPYLMADGGNVAVREIEGPNVYLQLQGACGTCPSSTMTMKMGLERGLKEKIPEIASVVQVPSEGGSALNAEAVEAVLEEVRPFLQMAGGTIEVKSLTTTGIAPTVVLRMEGEGGALTSVKVEIQQRLKRKLPALVNVMWD